MLLKSWGLRVPRVLVVLIAIGSRLFSGMAWVAAIERVGGWLEDAYQLARQRWSTWQDRRAGAAALIERDEVVEEGKKKFEIHEPVRIEPPAPQIPKSARVEREKQVPLFIICPIPR